MIKTLKSATQKNLVKEDFSKWTVFQIKFGPVESRKYKNTAQLNFSPDTVVYWGDGDVSKSPATCSTSRQGYNYKHIYSKKFISKNPIITIKCEGYPVYDRNAHGSEYNPLGGPLLYRAIRLSEETESAFGLFAYANQMTEIPENIFSNTSIQKFDICFFKSGITSIPQKLFDFATDKSSFNRTFSECENLVESDLIFRSASARTFKDFNFLFQACVNLKKVSPSMFKFINDSASLMGTFSGCKSLTVPRGLLDNQVKPIIPRLFENCDFKVADFLKDVPRLPLDLFANIPWTIDGNSIFEDAVRHEEKLKFIDECNKDPLKFELAFKDRVTSFVRLIG